MFESLFQLLFEYRPVVFSQGELRFAAWGGSYVALLVAGVAVVAAVATYRSGARVKPRDRFVLAAIRVALIALVAVCLFRPVLVVKAAVAQQNFIGVLLDDSRSMQIADQNGAPAIVAACGRSSAPPIVACSRRCRTGSWSAPSGFPPPPRASTLRTISRSTVRKRGWPPRSKAPGRSSPDFPWPGWCSSATAPTRPRTRSATSLLALKSQGVPVFTVGVGRETLPRDIEIGRVNTPRFALKGTTLMIDVLIGQTGFAGQTVTLDVEDEGRIVGSQQVTLPGDGSAATARVRFTASDAGARVVPFPRGASRRASWSPRTISARR